MRKQVFDQLQPLRLGVRAVPILGKQENPSGFAFFMNLSLCKTKPAEPSTSCFMATAIGGENSASGARRFRDDVLCMKPDLLSIDYALNDRGIGVQAAEASWRSMIDEALSAKVKVVLMTPTPDLSEDISDNNAPLVAYVSMIRVNHPNEAGHKVVVEEVMKVLFTSK